MVASLLCMGPILSAQTVDDDQAAVVEWEVQEDRWYSLIIGGAHAGWIHHVRSSDGKRYRTWREMQLQLNRAGSNMSVGSNATFIETHDGQPIEITATQLMGLSEVKRQITFSPEGVLVVTQQGDRKYRQLEPSPSGSWFMPAAMERFVEARIASKASKIQYRTADIEMGFRIVDVEMNADGDQNLNLQGREIPVLVYQSKVTDVPLVSRELYELDGGLIRSITSLPIGDMVTEISTKNIAQAEAQELPEVMLQTFVQPDRAIPNSIDLTTARYKLRSESSSLKDLPSAGAQHVEPSDKKQELEIVVDIGSRQPATDEEKSDAAFIQPSLVADGADAAIKKLSESALISVGDSDFDRAEAMRRFVNEYVSLKSLNTAFATASEVARSRSGDCSEHAVLLVAMLRSQGIPARSATGLIYADVFVGHKQIFGWHMWTQALIDGDWVDFDATLPCRFTAGHILVGTSSLADGSMAEDLVSMLGLMGNLKIDVISLGYEPEPKR